MKLFTDLSRLSLEKKEKEGGAMLNKKSISIGCLVAIFLFVCLIPAGAQQLEMQEQEKAAPTEITVEPTVIGESKPYTLGKEDVVQISVQNQPEFSGQFVIGPDGKIQYSFVGDIEAAGLNKEELKEKLIKELERFVKAPEISVAIVAYRSKNIYVLGEVGRPGKYPMKGDVISLREAIVEAGLPTREAAVRRVYIIKSDVEEPTYRKVDLYALLYKGNLKYNLDLFPGDIVAVPSTVPSEINRALNTLLSPVFQAAAVDALLDRNR